MTLLSTTLALSVQVRAQDGPSGPIDITADEQEFADDHVLAKGKVRVTYGDTIIDGPIAKLFRDETGAANRAVFTGNPRLVQGKNKINAAKLTFELKTSSIIADGNAHSEVYTDEDTGSQNDKAAGGSKIITDSQRQDYDRESGRFEAHGNVRVNTGDVRVTAKHMKIVYGTNRKPEAAVFTGDAIAYQNKNVTQADNITYFMTTQRMQATGHVRSRVIEEKSDAGDDGSSGKIASSQKDANQPILIYSDAQDYNKQTNRMDAVGNVKIYYQDSIGKGPKVALIKDANGKPERMIFTGRSQVNQPGRKWIGDKITLMIETRKVLAEGNTRAVIVQNTQTSPNAPKAVPAPEAGKAQLADQRQGKQRL